MTNNVLTKNALQLFPFPFTICLIGLIVQTVLARTRIRMSDSAGKDSPSYAAVFPNAVAVTCSFVFHRIALMNGSVGLTITAKSMSTVFVALQSAFLFGESLSTRSRLGILCVVGGVALSSATDGTFRWVCFVSALLSGLSVSIKVVLNKRTLLHFGSRCDPRMIYFRTISLATALTTPICLAFEGRAVLVHANSVLGDSDLTTLYTLLGPLLLSGFGLAWMEMASFSVVRLVTPTTHAVCNGARSLSIILFSIMYYRTPTSMQRFLGIFFAVAGCFLYATDFNQKKKRKEK